MASNSSPPPSLRLGDGGRRAAQDIARKRGLTGAEAARQAIFETAERERRRSGLAAEVAALGADPLDGLERSRVMADIDALGAKWGE